MTDTDTTVDAYIEIWNETDPAKRKALIEQAWSEDASYLDPMMAAEGRDAIDAMAASVQEQFPNHTFRLAGPIDSHHDRVRFLWEVTGPNGDGAVMAGLDFGILAPDGRLRSITGFIDSTP